MPVHSISVSGHDSPYILIMYLEKAKLSEPCLLRVSNRRGSHQELNINHVQFLDKWELSPLSNTRPNVYIFHSDRETFCKQNLNFANSFD